MPASTSSPSKYEMIAQALAQFSIFKDIPIEELQLLDAVKLPTVRRGSTIFRQGDIISRIFLVQQGAIELVHTDARGRTLRRIVRPGQVLGRLELDIREGQMGTARVLSPAELIAVDTSALMKLRANHLALQSNFDRSDVIGHLRANPYLAPLDNVEIKWISDIVEIERSGPGYIFYEAGEEAQNVVIIRRGRVRLDEGENSRWVSAGAVIGYEAALSNARHRHTASVENRGVFFILPKDDLQAIVKRHRHHKWHSPPIDAENLLHRAPIFQNFSLEEIRKLAGFVMQVHYHTPHQPIVQADKYDHYYYILANGNALQKTYSNEGNLIASTTVGRGFSFGEASLLFGDPAKYTVETIRKTDWIRIHRQDFDLFLKENQESKEHITIPDALQQRMEERVFMAQWQRDDEEILSLYRRHWIVLLKRKFRLVLFWLVQLLIAAILRLATGSWHLVPHIIFAAFYTILWVGWIVVDYMNDFHIVTTQRVVHHEKVLFFKEERDSALMTQVQELSVNRSMLGRLLGYGDLIIRTAASDGDILFDHHPHPNKTHKIIQKEMTRIKKHSMEEQQASIMQQLQDRLHLGLEERIDERALMDNPLIQQRIRQRRGLSFMPMVDVRNDRNNSLIWRRHWFGLVKKTVLLFIASLFLLAILLAGMLGMFGSLLQDLSWQAKALGFSVLVLFWLISLAALWWIWTDWYNDRYIVTDQLIERVQKTPLMLDEDRTTISLNRVQNVDFKRPTLLSNLLNFGYVSIQTAAADKPIVFDSVPSPSNIHFEILDRIKNYQDNLDKKRQREHKNDFVEWLEAYHKLVNREQAP